MSLHEQLRKKVADELRRDPLKIETIEQKADRIVRACSPLLNAEQQAGVVHSWSDEQCLQFASVAFRHAPKNLPAGVSLDDIRMAAARVETTAQTSDARDGGWIAFSDRWPNESPALDDPSVKTMDTVLVTNNIKSRDRMGRLCNVWLAAPIQGEREIVAFEGYKKIHGLTHWKDAGLSKEQPR